MSSKHQIENQRQYEVVDMLLSIHSVLRERYMRRAFCLNTAQIGVSLFLSIFAFVSDDVLEALGYSPALARFVVGFAAVIALLLSITEFRADWRTVAIHHGEAADGLGELKAQYRRAFVESGGGGSEDLGELTRRYEETMAKLVAVPETRFSRLKAMHGFKQVLSRRVSEYPAAPWWFLRLQLRIEGMAAAVRRRGRGTAKGELGGTHE